MRSTYRVERYFQDTPSLYPDRLDCRIRATVGSENNWQLDMEAG
jgi:hypothetical protein